MASMHHVGRGGLSPRELEKIYPFPQITGWHEDWRRYRHELADENLDDEALIREGRRARRRADYEPEPGRRTWLTERIEAERARRAMRLKQELRSRRWPGERP